MSNTTLELETLSIKHFKPSTHGKSSTEKSMHQAVCANLSTLDRRSAKKTRLNLHPAVKWLQVLSKAWPASARRETAMTPRASDKHKPPTRYLTAHSQHNEQSQQITAKTSTSNTSLVQEQQQLDPMTGLQPHAKLLRTVTHISDIGYKGLAALSLLRIASKRILSHLQGFLLQQPR